MAILATLFAFVGRQLGRVVTTAVGWASTMLFGRVPQHRQLLLARMTLGSLGWFAMLLGVVIPDIGTVLIGLVPAPDFVPEMWMRLAMLAGAIAVPLAIGGAGLMLPEPGDRARGFDVVRQIVRGYPLAFLLAFTLLFLALVGGARKVRSLVRRWSEVHVPMVVRPGQYEAVVSDLENALELARIVVVAKPAPRFLSAPARLVGLVAGRGVRALVPDRLTMLVAPDLEILVYPSDVALSGSKAVVTRARAALASRLTAAAAFLTTTKEAQDLEDRLQRIVDAERHLDAAGRPAIPPGMQRELAAIDAALATVQVEYDEWEVLYRMRLQVERDLLTGSRVGHVAPGLPSVRPVPARRGSPPEKPSMLAVAGLAIVALDLLLALFDRFRSPSRSRAD